MHGPDHHHLYSGPCPGAGLRWRADRIRERDRAGHDVFACFSTDGNAGAVRNARTLRALPVSGAASHPAAHAVSTGWHAGLPDVRGEGD
jgi:hypothetical protein